MTREITVHRQDRAITTSQRNLIRAHSDQLAAKTDLVAIVPEIELALGAERLLRHGGDAPGVRDQTARVQAAAALSLAIERLEGTLRVFEVSNIVGASVRPTRRARLALAEHTAHIEI